MTDKTTMKTKTQICWKSLCRRHGYWYQHWYWITKLLHTSGIFIRM